MKKRTIFTLAFTCLISIIFAQEVRTYDGSNNNLSNPEWGSINSQLARLVPADYGDKISTPAGVQRQNPRKISNALFAQDSPLTDPLGLSDFVWVFGQIIDHDITLSEGNGEPAMIPINFPDAHFNPGGALPNVVIPMTRTAVMAGTGTSEDNPREHFNQITAWLDGSAIYGSDAFRANWLRAFEGGKLKTSAGDLLPFNTKNGEFDSFVDDDAPRMADDVGFATRLFVAGDIRANENVLLTAYHTLFVREHNRICAELILANPNWQDERIYQHARKIVGGIFQAITFDEWLPAMGVNLPAYAGYNSTFNPEIYNGFSAAAYRMGHTLLSGDILVMDENGNERQEGPLKLRNAFFNPNALVDNGGLDPFFRGMAAQVQQDMDAKVVDDVRNFLFGAPGSGAGGLDLAAININRGRERGLPDFNTFRVGLGLSAYSFFGEISSDAAVVEALQSNYTSINDIDPWVGMLAEAHMSNALFGETVMAFMLQQFTAIRNGDRFYYENDSGLTPAEKAAIKATKMSDVVMRNTNINLMQDDVFEAMPHQEICGFFGQTAKLNGMVTNELGSSVLNVEVELINEDNELVVNSIANGSFTFNDINTCEEVTIKLAKNDRAINGVTTLDMVFTIKHILGILPFDSPYKIIAADVNKSGAVTTADLVNIRKVILGKETSFPNNTSWRFVDADYNFLDDNPLDEDFPEIFTINLSQDKDLNFVAIKVGDVNASADPSSLNDGLLANKVRTNQPLVFHTEDMEVIAGQTYTIPFETNNEASIIGYQFTMNYSQDVLGFQSLDASKTLTIENIAMQNGLIKASWNELEAVNSTDLTFAFTFIAKEDGRLSELLSIQSNPTVAEAYNEDLKIMEVKLQFIQPATAELQLYQNRPNPFKNSTTIGFDLPENSNIQLAVFDMAGKQLQLIEGFYNKGYNTIPLNTENLASRGILYYQLHTSFGSITRKMMVIE